MTQVMPSLKKHHLGAAGARRRRQPIRSTIRNKPGNEIIFTTGFPTESGRGKIVRRMYPAGRTADQSIRWCSPPAACSNTGTPVR